MRALEAVIREFIAAHNADAKPFVWTKTADEILASIARFAQRTLSALGSLAHWRGICRAVPVRARIPDADVQNVPCRIPARRGIMRPRTASTTWSAGPLANIAADANTFERRAHINIGKRVDYPVGLGGHASNERTIRRV